jgi:hypothetical protein
MFEPKVTAPHLDSTEFALQHVDFGRRDLRPI